LTALPDDVLTSFMSEIRVELPDHLLGKLARAAEAAGMTSEELAGRLVSAELFDSSEFEWGNGNPSDPLPPRDLNEPTHAWDDVKSELQAKRAAARRKRA
jgi:hypothetical protein